MESKVVSGVNFATGELKFDDGSTLLVSPNSGVSVKIDGKPSEFTKIEIGDRVEQHLDNGKLVVLKVRRETPDGVEATTSAAELARRADDANRGSGSTSDQPGVLSDIQQHPDGTVRATYADGSEKVIGTAPNREYQTGVDVPVGSGEGSGSGSGSATPASDPAATGEQKGPTDAPADPASGPKDDE
jgi:hypothetical protein